MVIGSGMMAKAFKRYQNYRHVLIFASGVANSGEIDQTKFDREVRILVSAIRQFPEHLLVYFSTCSIDDKDVSESPYVLHKLRIESLIRSMHHNYLIFRLPQVVGRSLNRTTLVNYLYDKIISGERFDIWKNANRYLIDVDDVVMIANHIIDDNSSRNKTINIVSRPYSVLDIVAAIENLTGKRGTYDLIDKGTPYSIDDSPISEIVKKLNISFDRSYLDSLLSKYYGKQSGAN